MQSLPFLVSLGVAVAIVPAAVQGLRSQGFVRQNYRGVEVAFPAGVTLIGTVAVTSWGPGRFDIFVRGNDKQLWHRWFDAGAWQNWT